MTTPVAPPPSYPGTVKVFDQYNDGEVIYAAYGTEWTGEIDAIEGILGANPQIDYLGTDRGTVSGRLTYLEGDTLRLEGNQVVSGTKEFSNTVQVDGFLIGNGADVNFKYADRQYHFTDTGLQQLLGNGSSYEDLVLQPTGGQVKRGGYTMWDAGNDGSGSGLDADLLDGHHASDFLLASGAEAISTHTQTVPNCTNASIGTGGWQDLALDTVTYQDNSFGTVYPGDGWFHIVIDGIYIVTVTLTWTPGAGQSWSGYRGIHIRDDTGLWLAHAAFNVPSIAMYSAGAPMELTRGRYLTAGTKIKAAVWQNSGGPLDITTTTLPKPPGSTAVSYPTGMTVSRVA